MFEFLKECDQFNIYVRAHDCEIKATAYDCVTPIAVFFEVTLKSLCAYFHRDNCYTSDPNLFELLQNETLTSLISDKYGFNDFSTVHAIRKKSNALKHDENATTISASDKESFFKCLFSFCTAFYSFQTGKTKPKWNQEEYSKLFKPVNPDTALLETIQQLEDELQKTQRQSAGSEAASKAEIERLQASLRKASELQRETEGKLIAAERRISEEDLQRRKKGELVQFSTEYIPDRGMELKAQTAPKTISLSANQQKAVDCTDKYIAVVAGPGSGKTRVLTERIQHLVVDANVPESRILALSFSSKAANEVRKRLKDRLGVRACRIEVKTFHSFGLGLIRQNLDLLGFKDDVEIVDSTEKYRIIRKLLDKQRGGSVLTPAAIQQYAQTISGIKGGMANNDYHIQQLCDAYNKELRRGNYVDFDDMVGLARELLIRYPDIRADYKKKYDHVLIDEVQDVNAWQVDVIRGIVGPQTTLFVVGDDDQCIYEWRGAIPSYLQGLANNKAFTVIHLEDNYRSETAIVKASASFISRNMNRIQKRIQSRKKNQEIVRTSTTYAHWLPNKQAEADFIAERIESIVKNENYTYSDITILARQHSQFVELKNALIRCQIPFSCQEESNYNDFFPVLQAVANIGHKGNISRAVNYPNRIMDNFLYQDLCAKYHLSNDMTVPEVFDYLNSINDVFEDCELFRARFSLIKELSEKAKHLTVSEIIRRLCDHYSSDEERLPEDKLQSIRAMLVLAEDFDNGYSPATASKSAVEEFMDYVRLSEEDDSKQDNDKLAVNLMTCHRSKGLEFPIVFIPGVQCGNFPDNKFIHSTENVEAERRLLYVSMTRAIDRLYITAYNDPYTGDVVCDRQGNVLFSYKGFLADIPDLVLKREENC